MEYVESRQIKIEILAGDGKLEDLKKLLALNYTQLEIDEALGNAIAYSQIKTAEYLLLLGADISKYNYNGVYYAAHNNELEGLKFAIKCGVDINVEDGMFLNTGIETAINTKSIEMVKWLLDNGADPKLLKPHSLSLINRYGTRDLKNLVESFK